MVLAGKKFPYKLGLELAMHVFIFGAEEHIFAVPKNKAVALHISCICFDKNAYLEILRLGLNNVGPDDAIELK